MEEKDYSFLRDYFVKEKLNEFRLMSNYNTKNDDICRRNIQIEFDKQRLIFETWNS